MTLLPVDMSVCVKICGLRDHASVEAAVSHGARMVGFVFFRRSPRFVKYEQVAKLADRVPDNIERVGVTVDADDDLLRHAISAGRLTMIQFHGHECSQRIADVRQRFGVKAMKVVRVHDASDITHADAFLGVADYIMFDAAPPPGADRPGGNAVSFDWTVLKGRSHALPWVLSGGLQRENLTDAVSLSSARIVDVSSGVETEPGRKSPELIRGFLEAAHSIGSTT